ncbi:XRE family transcriptional regulator [Nocardia zapadnayensis]|uniref:helix-turn-helix domain-containing protein n=1 Tax=uncultured Brevibacterium sp. TaxID=189678 RepID=UPI00224550CE|nr:XRE family transcriptional regulator [Nocardia zapadnayensis]MCX0275831.1 XRE family transcriptional regulator [Nocardia zapadnayensis]
MDTQLIEVGQRIRSHLPAEMTQRGLAEAVGMKPDALSRALSAQRGFTLSEITRIARALDADLTWLLTGAPNPHHLEFAARHAWDPQRKERSNPGARDDAQILDRIADLYRRAFPGSVPASRAIPADPQGVRASLGPDFVRTFAESIEATFEIDVIRMAGLSTDYSLRIGERGIIVLNSNPSWFRSNWSLAHELAHLALGHHDGSRHPVKARENDADAFAAELLLPAEQIRAHDWSAMSESELTQVLWTLGVSTRALLTRLRFLEVAVSAEAGAALESSTPALLRGAPDPLDGARPNRRAVADRQQQASSQRFPLALVEALTARVESGEADPGELAFVLGVDIEDVLTTFEVEEPETEAEAVDRLLDDPAHRRSTPALGAWLESRQQA